MVTGDIKNRIDSIWDDLFAAGLANPLTVIEQLSYLIFIHNLDDNELKNEQMENISHKKASHIFNESQQELRWSKFKGINAEQMFRIVRDEVFPFIKHLNGNNETAFSNFMKDATFLIPNPQTLETIVTKLDRLFDEIKENIDILGDIYEYMLSKISSAKQLGQFRTPKQIRDMMVKLVKPTPDDFICDPACGTAGFLISSAEYIEENFSSKMSDKQWNHFEKDLLTGYDTDPTMLRISSMNLMLHAIPDPRISYKDSISKENTCSEYFDIILANPPFKGTINKNTINTDLTNVCSTQKTELLFVTLFMRMLKKGGRCACIVPDGVLFGSSKAHKALRKELIENQQLQAVISMPSGVFKPYAGVSTAVLIFTKTDKGGTDKIWFYDMKSDGFSLDDKRQPIEANDIPDIISRFNNLKEEYNRKRTDQSFFVPKQEIIDNDYDLSINKYKEIEYVPIEYPPTGEIMAKLHDLESEVSKNLSVLDELLSKEDNE